MATRHGGQGRTSTKAKLAGELTALGQLLADVREGAGLKQADVAARLGMPASYLSKIENGSRRVDVIELIRIAEAMGQDPAAIMAALRERLGS